MSTPESKQDNPGSEAEEENSQSEQIAIPKREMPNRTTRGKRYR